MNITAFSVRNYPFTIVVFALLVGVGILSLSNIPRTEDPSLSFPGYTVTVVDPGANPTELERLVAKLIEDGLKELDDITKLQSTIRDGVAIVSVEFKYGIDVDRKFDDVLRQVNQVRPTLPSGITFFDTKHSQTSDVAILQLALVSPTASFGRMQDAAETLRKRLEIVPGIKKSEKWAYPERQVRITLDPDRVARLRLPVDRIIAALNANNVNIPGGSAELDGRRFTVKTSGSYSSLDQISSTVVSGDGSSLVRIRDIADVRWGYEDQEHIGRFKGERAVFVTALAQNGQSIARVTEGLESAIEEFRAGLPSDMRLEVGFEQARNIERRLGRLRGDLLVAIALVALTVAPLGWRAALLVMVSIPLSLAMGIAALYGAGHSLNQLSIVGFVIALGLLVDDSIVVVENISRFRRLGHSPVDAAIGATRQISVAVIGTTATLLFAFLPLLMLPGDAGAFIRSLPLAVEFTVVASLVVALTIMPFLASRFLVGEGHAEGNLLLRTLQRAIHSTYRPVLHWAMQHRMAALSGSALLLAGTLSLVPSIRFSLFPKAGTPHFLISFEAPEGAGIDAADRIARQIDNALLQTPEVEWWFTNVGHGNPAIYYNLFSTAQKPNRGDIFAQIRPELASDVKTPVILNRLRAKLTVIPGAQILVREFENGPPVDAPIAVRIFGEDLDQLSRLAQRTERQLASLPGTVHVNNPVRTQRTDLRVRIDHASADLLGIPNAEIDRAVRMALAGLDVARYREENGDEHNIELALPRGEHANLDQWQKIAVQTASGGYVPLAQVARLDFDSSPAVIQRHHRERCVTVTSFVADGVNVDRTTKALDTLLRASDWPKGTYYEFGGEIESRKTSFGNLGTAIMIAVFGVFAILVLEFRSFRGTVIVASVIPLGVIGGLLALWLTGYTLSFTAMVGFVALVGIEIKNSILLVDFTNQLRERGVPLKQAIEEAGEVRFLPVVLTTLTALGALLPLAVQGAGLYSPLAIVIIGGLISSLLLSRIITPVLYSLIPPPSPETPTP